MKRVKVSQSEFLSLIILAYKAKMDWFDEDYGNKNRKTVDRQDLEDLSTALQDFVLNRVDIYDLNNAMAVFSRAKLCNNDIINAKSFIEEYENK